MLIGTDITGKVTHSGDKQFFFCLITYTDPRNTNLYGARIWVTVTADKVSKQKVNNHTLLSLLLWDFWVGVGGQRGSWGWGRVDLRKDWRMGRRPLAKNHSEETNLYLILLWKLNIHL